MADSQTITPNAASEAVSMEIKTSSSINDQNNLAIPSLSADGNIPIVRNPSVMREEHIAAAQVRKQSLTPDANIPMARKASLLPDEFIRRNSVIPADQIELKPIDEKKTDVRRIIAEDPEWNLAAIESLSTICLKVIVKNFEKNPILDGLPEKYRERIISSISVDLPLKIVSKLIPDESYWQRRAIGKYNLCSIEEHGNSWKQLYFEMYTRDLIESFVPKTSGDEAIENIMADLKISSEFVEKLIIRQLHPTEPDDLNPSKKNITSNIREAPKELIIKPTDPLPNHLNINILFNFLPNLKSLDLFYGVKDCGINFNWVYFGMTITDCQRISDSIKANPSLTHLLIRSSAIDDDKCRILSNALYQNMIITNLDLSYNDIGDIGAHALSKVLLSPTSALKSLNLSNNKIGKEGGLAIARSLAQNNVLTDLDLRLNYLGDEGSDAICFHACKNQVLEKINLSGNGMGTNSVSAICILLRKNLKKLQCLDFSCNRLGTYGSLESGILRSAQEEQPNINSEGDLIGKSIFDAVSRNKYIIRLDLRMTNLSEEYTLAIQGILKENSFL